MTSPTHTVTPTPIRPPWPLDPTAAAAGWADTFVLAARLIEELRQQVEGLRLFRALVEVMRMGAPCWKDDPDVRTQVVVNLTKFLAEDVRWRASLTDLLAVFAEAPRHETMTQLARWARAVDEERRAIVELATPMLTMASEPARASLVAVA
jgi:hypothetical protein